MKLKFFLILFVGFVQCFVFAQGHDANKTEISKERQIELLEFAIADAFDFIIHHDGIYKLAHWHPAHKARKSLNNRVQILFTDASFDTLIRMIYFNLLADELGIPTDYDHQTVSDPKKIVLLGKYSPPFQWNHFWNFIIHENNELPMDEKKLAKRLNDIIEIFDSFTPLVPDDYFEDIKRARNEVYRISESNPEFLQVRADFAVQKRGAAPDLVDFTVLGQSLEDISNTKIKPSFENLKKYLVREYWSMKLLEIYPPTPVDINTQNFEVSDLPLPKSGKLSMAQIRSAYLQFSPPIYYSTHEETLWHFYFSNRPSENQRDANTIAAAEAKQRDLFLQLLLLAFADNPDQLLSTHKRFVNGSTLLKAAAANPNLINETLKTHSDFISKYHQKLHQKMTQIAARTHGSCALASDASN